MPTASALLKAKQPLAVLAVAVAASSTSAADASAIALSADFAIEVVDSNHDALATMLVGRGEDSRKKDSMMTAAPTATPTVAAAAGTAIYQDSYGGTVAPAEALKKVGEYCVKATTAAPTGGVVRVSHIIDRF